MTQFGPDVTAAFCLREKIQLIVRSHEFVSDGVRFMHSGRLATLFSARDYQGVECNDGALLLLAKDETGNLRVRAKRLRHKADGAASATALEPYSPLVCESSDTWPGASGSTLAPLASLSLGAGRQSPEVKGLGCTLDGRPQPLALGAPRPSIQQRLSDVSARAAAASSALAQPAATPNPVNPMPPPPPRSPSGTTARATASAALRAAEDPATPAPRLAFRATGVVKDVGAGGTQRSPSPPTQRKGSGQRPDFKHL